MGKLYLYFYMQLLKIRKNSKVEHCHVTLSGMYIVLKTAADARVGFA